MVDLARQNWRDYEVDGVAASGKHKPNKAKIRQWGTWVESVITAFTSNGGLVYATRALLYADLLHGANTSAWVVSDSTGSYNGIYQKSGISGAGAWTRIADLPYSFITCADAGAGTANVIVATSSISAPSTAGAALFLCNIFEANSGAVTLALNGAAAKPVITNSGNALSSGYLVAGMQVVFIDDGANWRLVSDVASAAVLAAAEAAQAAAELAAANAALYDGVWFDTVVLMLADITKTYGNTATGDYFRTRAEGFSYKAAASGASDHHLVNAGGVKLYVVAGGDVVNIKAFGAVGDGTTDDTAEIQAAITFACDNARALYIPGASYKISSTLNVVKRIRIFGDGMWQSLLVYTGAGVALQVSPPAGGVHNTGYAFHDFGVKPSVDGGGTFGIDIYLATSAFFSNWEMARVYIGDFGNYGLHLDNAIANGDGFFTCTIRRCWIHNGINGVNIGDSITIVENTITGSRLALPGILMSGLSGARQLVLRENNITTQAGGIALTGVEQPQILFNQIEHPAYIGNYTGPYDAIVWLNNVSLALIQGNTISPAAGSCVSANYALFFESTSAYNTIDGNNISKGEVYHVAFNTTSTFNVLRKNNTYDATPVILNVPVNNLGVYVDLTPVNSWVTYTTGTGIAVKRDEGGKIFVRGALKDGTVTTGTILTTLPVGFRPTRGKRFQTTNYNGSAYSSATLEVNTSGEIIVRLAAANNMLHLDGICFDEE